MKIRLSIFLILLLVISCKTEPNCHDIRKPVDLVEGLSGLNQMLYNRIQSIAFKDYYKALEASSDTTDIKKRNLAFQLYKANELADSLSNLMRLTIFSKSNNLRKDQQDTLSFAFVINNHSKKFTKDMLNDPRIQNSFRRLQNCQEKVYQIKEKIISSQTGNGHIVCRALGDKITVASLTNVSDFWDILYLIESTHYILSKDILCTFSNLSCYNNKINFTFITDYDGSPIDVRKWTPNEEK